MNLNNEFVESKEEIEIESNYVPSEDEEYMNSKQLCYFRRRLLDWKSELLSESQKVKEHLITNNFNESDDTDRANVESDTFHELNNRDRKLKLLEKIDDALKRIENGEYGYCENTGKEIGVKRLRARLVATLCIEEQEMRERKKRNYFYSGDVN
uniref:Uncharacterized protein n=1 Tax=Biomphalaria glabrata TaxID=6526 RepID=A0A2C9LIX9_BIOGL